MRTKRYVATALSLTMFSAAALADDYPPRKPGLWLVTIQAAVGPPATMKMCIDADTDQIFHKIGTDLRSKRCAKNDVKVDGDTISAESECKIGSSTVTTTSVTKFDGDTAYHSDVTSHFDPALLGKTDTTITQDGKWSGDCPADMKPGDFVLANGIKINVKTLNFLKSFIPGR
jgi:hypothetical protein